MSECPGQAARAQANTESSHKTSAATGHEGAPAPLRRSGAASGKRPEGAPAPLLWREVNPHTFHISGGARTQNSRSYGGQRRRNVCLARVPPDRSSVTMRASSHKHDTIGERNSKPTPTDLHIQCVDVHSMLMRQHLHVECVNLS